MEIILNGNVITSGDEFLSACMGILSSGASQMDLCSVLAASGLGEAMARANAVSRDPVDGPLGGDGLEEFLRAVFHAASRESELDSLGQLLERERLHYDDLTAIKGRCFLSYRIAPMAGVRISSFRRALPKIEALLQRPVRLAVDGDSLVLETVRPGSASPEHAAIEETSGGMYPLGAGLGDGVVGITSPDLLVVGEKGSGRSSLLRQIIVSCCRRAGRGDVRIAHVCHNAGDLLSIPDALSVRCGEWKGSVSGSYPAVSVVNAVRHEMAWRRTEGDSRGPDIVLFIDDLDMILEKWDLEGEPGLELRRVLERSIAEIAMHGRDVGIHLVASTSSYMSSEFESVLAYAMADKAVMKCGGRLFDLVGAQSLSAPGDGLLLDMDGGCRRFRCPDVPVSEAEQAMRSAAGDAPSLMLVFD